MGVVVYGHWGPPLLIFPTSGGDEWEFERQGMLDALGGRLALNLPALNVRVADMLAALEAVAGPEVRARVRFERDPVIAAIVANWPIGASAARAARPTARARSRCAGVDRRRIHAGTWPHRRDSTRLDAATRRYGLSASSARC